MTSGVVCGSAGLALLVAEPLEPASSTSREEVSPNPQDPLTSHLEIIQRIIQKAGFSRKVAHHSGRSQAALYHSK